MSEIRVQRSRRKGWRKPAGAVVVSRPSRWGNPYPVAEHGRDQAIRLYEQHLLASPDLIARLPELRGRQLVCWCPLDQPCHADVLARYANEGFARS
jgi:hypothetical protein